MAEETLLERIEATEHFILDRLKSKKDAVLNIKSWRKKITTLPADKAENLSFISKLHSKRFKKNLDDAILQLLAGNSTEEAVKNISKNNNKHIEHNTELFLDPNGVDESAYQKDAISLIQSLAKHGLKATVTIKPHLLTNIFDLTNFDQTVEKVLAKLRPILRQAKALGIKITLDTDSYASKSVVLEVFKQLLNEDEFRNSEEIGIKVYSYFKDSSTDIEALLDFAEQREHSFELSISGENKYLDEISLAQKHKWPLKTFDTQKQVNSSFEKLTNKLLKYSSKIHTRFVTNNIKQIALIIESAKAKGIAKPNFSFELMNSISTPIIETLIEMEYEVIQYAPIASLETAKKHLTYHLQEPTNKSIPKYQALFDFSRNEVRDKLERSTKAINDKYFARKFGLVIHGKEIATDEWKVSSNPRKPQDIVGISALASLDDTRYAVESCKQALEEWSTISSESKREYIAQMAEVINRSKYELVAIIVAESGKNWHQAAEELAQAIHACKYYATKLIEQKKNAIATINCDDDSAFAKGVSLTVAAIAAGNCVILVPNERTPISLAHFMQILKEINLPAGVVNYLPNSRDYLVNSESIEFEVQSSFISIDSLECKTQNSAFGGLIPTDDDIKTGNLNYLNSFARRNG